MLATEVRFKRKTANAFFCLSALLLIAIFSLSLAGCSGLVSQASKSGPTPVAPSITTQPASQTVTTGQTATFSVAATGTAPLSYQWKKNGTAISGATSSSYTTPATTSSDNGAQFTVVVSNTVGSVTSSAATLTVSSGTTPPSVPTGLTALATSSSQINLTWNASTGSVAGYKIFRGGSQVGTSTTTSYSDTGLATSTSYTYTVAAYDAAGNTSAQSAGASATTLASGTGSAMANLALSMAPGTWAQFTTTGYNNGALMRPPDGGSLLEFAERGQWNPVNKTVMFVGGAHPAATTPCGSTLFVKYTDSTNTWVNNLPNPCPNFDNATGIVAVNVVHPYDHQDIVPTTGDLYHRQYSSGKVMKFSHATQSWSQCSQYNHSGSSTTWNDLDHWQADGSLVYFSDRNSLIMLDGDWGLWELSLASGNCTGSWNLLATTNGGTGGFGGTQLTGIGSSGNIGAYSALCQCVLLGNGGTSKLYKYDKAGTITTIAPAPKAMQIPQAGAGSVFTVDPATGKFLLWDDSNASTTMYEYDPLANTWTTISRNAPIFPGPEGGAFDVIATPISDYKVIMFFSSGGAGGGSVYLYKHAAGSSQGGSLTISSVTVSSITTSSATIGWSTSAPADSQVDYGLTSGYGLSTALDSSTVSSHSVSLSNLTAGTLYHYRVKSHDSSGTLVTSGDATFMTSTGVPTTPPSVSISSPVAGSTVSGSTAVSASASSSVGMAGVQFQVDSVSVGSEVTSSPYSINWDTTTVSNGAHTVTAVARDTVGNTATSIGIPVTVSNSGVPTGSADFQTRCSSAGVVRCVGFDTASDIAGTWGNNVGIMSGAVAPGLDTTVKASGNSSLKFTIPSLSSAGASGSYFANFSSDLATQYGENSEFYLQWRQRFSPEYLTTNYQGGEGWKQIIIGTGDIVGCTPTSGSATCSTSCTDLEIVAFNAYQLGYTRMYDSCTGSTSHGAYDPFSQPFATPWNGANYKMQNAMPSPFCLYDNQGKSPLPPTGNCFGYFPNEWMTFQVHVKMGPRVNDEFTNSFVQLWIAREGQPSTLVIDWGPYNLSAGSASANQKYGKVWLLPYNTGKDPSVSYPVAYTWYDELIVSTQHIADPK